MRKPNIVVIMADDAGVGDFQTYNQDTKIETPNFSKIANEGTLFEKAYSPGTVCTQTRYALLTGRHHFRTGQRGAGVVFNYTDPIIGDEPTIQRALSKQGYGTYCSGKWHLGIDWQKTDKEGTGMFENESIDFGSEFRGPTDTGFDRFYGIRASLDMPPYCFLEDGHIVGYPSKEKQTYYNQQREGPQSEVWDDFEVGRRITSKAVSFISEAANRDSPFLLYVPTSAPHRPCLPPDYVEGVSSAGKRGDMVTHFDWTIGCIDNQLQEMGVQDNTILVITSDHGPKPSEKDFDHDPTNGLKGRKGSLHEGGFRIPLILRYPNAGYVSSISDPVSSIDIFPTLCDMFGLDVDELDGVSFYDLLLGERSGTTRYILSENGGGRLAIQYDGWKYIQSENDDLGKLYHLDEDIKETENLADTRENKVDQLTSMIDRLVDEPLSIR